MKRIILLLILLFLSITCLGNQQLQQATLNRINSTSQTGGGDSSCDNLGSYEQYWDGEHTSGTAVACEQGGTETGTLNGATISTDQNHTTDGQYALDITDTDQYLEYNVDSKFTSSAGEVDIYFYPESGATDQQIFEAYVNAANFISIIVVGGTGKIRINHVSTAGGSQNSYSSGAVNAAAFNHAQARWSVANSQLDIQLNDEGWQNDDDAIAAFASEPTTFVYGEKSTGTAQQDTIYIDDCYVEATCSAR